MRRGSSGLRRLPVPVPPVPVQAAAEPTACSSTLSVRRWLRPWMAMTYFGAVHEAVKDGTGGGSRQITTHVPLLAQQITW